MSFCSGVGRQQASGQAEADRGESRAAAARGASEDGVGPPGALAGGMGADPRGHRSPHGHERPGQPLETETQIPGEGSQPRRRGSHVSHVEDVPLSPSQISPPSLPPQPIHTLLPDVNMSMFLYLLVEWGVLDGRWRLSSTEAAELTLTEHLCPSFLKLRFPNTLSLRSSSVCLSVFNRLSDCCTVVVLLSFNVT